MTRMHSVALGLGAFLLLASGESSAQSNLKIGFVNLNAIIQNAPQLTTINQQLRDEFAQRDSEFQSMQNDFNEKRDTFQRDAEVMAEAERQALTRELTQMQRDLERRAQELQEDLEIRQNELLGELQLEIVEKVQAYADLNDYDLIVTDAIYVSEAVDISAAVYDAISAAVGRPAGSASSSTDDE